MKIEEGVLLSIAVVEFYRLTMLGGDSICGCVLRYQSVRIRDL